MESSPAPDRAAPPQLDDRQVAVLLVSIFLVALCGIAYELIIGTVASYLIGNSVLQFSLTIGLFMFAMGIGSWLTRYITRDLLATFVKVELVLALVGGVSGVLLFLVFPLFALFKPTMYLLIIAVGTLVGLEIPILTRLLSARESLRESIASVLSLDYLGALVGSVAFPLALLPSLGLFRASFAIGLLNAWVALVNVIAFRAYLPARRLMVVLCVLVMVGLTGAVAGASWITRYAEGQLFFDRIVHQQTTPYQRIVVTENDRNGEMRLYLDGHVQFAERDEYRYHEALVHPVMSQPGPRGRVLVLGGGDGLAVRELLRYDEVEQIDLVDIDPAVTRLASSYPPLVALTGDSLSDPRVRIHHTDAFGFVRDARQQWDRVIIDLPDPHNEVLSKLYSVEFYRLLVRVMTAEAALSCQSSSPFFTREVYWSIAATMEAAGLHTLAYHVNVPAFSDWGFHLARPAGPPSRTVDLDVPTRFLTPETFHAAQVFARDVVRLDDTPVNSIFEPTLYHLYTKSLAVRF